MASRSHLREAAAPPDSPIRTMWPKMCAGIRLQARLVLAVRTGRRDLAYAGEISARSMRSTARGHPGHDVVPRRGADADNGGRIA